ncbi:MAG: protein kinase [Rhodoplanes sp.]|uniref:serine/threonine protein kinase n=1 Tax=Rhodoplanes sp. TaxID=1968906 RepID=UPI00181F6801|nr:bifunctional serine/threonine-protein kinase/universal stress protein [Rhodoplanes sp.]NVO15173.1 protein kinase [Rhodoplanes sp.]
MRDLDVGRVIEGFTLTERLRSGGMGSIWRATHPDITEPILLKIPFLDPGQDVSTIVGFEVEEMILKRLEGAHVPHFFASGDFADTPFIAMEYVAGNTLAAEMERAPFSWQTVAIYGIQIGTALAALHRQKVIHLDLKPGNVILAERGAVLIDFGLAHHEELPDLLAEESAVPMGTPAYISPEQVLGDRRNPASDIFALGCILYELATGERPFGEPTTKAGMQRRLYHAPVPPRSHSRDVPRWLQEIILKCMEIDPGRRYATAGQLVFDLRNPEQVVLTARADADAHQPRGWRKLVRMFAGRRANLAPIQPSMATRQSGAALVMAAVDLASGSDPLAEEVRRHVARVLDSEPGARLACFTVLKTKLTGMDDTTDPAGRSMYVNRLVALKDWAAPLRLPDTRVSFHVVEALDPANAILTYAAHNDVDHIVMGARASSALRRHLGSVSAQVVAEALCPITVIRIKRHEEVAEARRIYRPMLIPTGA